MEKVRDLQSKVKYLTEPATKVFLPVIIWWTFRNKHPVGTTGQRGDKGQVSKITVRSMALGTTLCEQSLFVLQLVKGLGILHFFPR